MIIRSMQATFGKLDEACLQFQPGLNILEAPNEWGKTTWAAFILAMFYGLDTKARSTRQTLADKERFLPWSGKPMEGRIELEYCGKRITIERSTKGRVPLGSFRAYETDTGIDIPELRGDNCGEILLGVEQSVFRRSGFIRMSDMAITEDEVLRRRLNDLVTTGDESGDAGALECGLKALKNRLSNRSSGVIQQTQNDYLSLAKQLQELETLENEEFKLINYLSEAEASYNELLNHRKHLENQKAYKDALEVERALDLVHTEQVRVCTLEEECKKYPDAASTQNTLQEIHNVNKELAELSAFVNAPVPELKIDTPYAQLTPGEARKQVEKDIGSYKKSRRPTWLLPIFLSALNFAAGIYVYFNTRNTTLSLIALLIFVVGLALGFFIYTAKRKERKALHLRYGSENTRKWEFAAAKMDALWNEYNLGMKSHQRALDEVRTNIVQLENQKSNLLQGREMEYFFRGLSLSEQLEDARNDLIKAQENYKRISAMAASPRLDLDVDKLSYGMQETEEKLLCESSELERTKGELQLIQYRKRQLGTKSDLTERRQLLSKKIEQLKTLEKAISLGLQVHHEASEDLHRRFSPGITHQAQEYLQIMSGKRYDKILINQNFSITAGNRDDTALRDLSFRSDGTIDQVYLAVRLAVAMILSPDAPIVLDDAFVRFDDQRLYNALSLLQEISETKQIILFSCQTREKCLLNKKPRS